MLVVILVSLLVCIYNVWWLISRKREGAPPLFPGWLPLIGHVHMFPTDTKKLYTIIVELADSAIKNEGAVDFCVGTRPVHVIADADACYRIGYQNLDKDEGYDFAKPWLGEGLVTSPGKIWRRHRKIIGPAFSQQVLNSYIPIFNKYAKHLVNEWSKKGSEAFDAMDDLKILSFDIVCETSMGLDEPTDISLRETYLNVGTEILAIVANRYCTIWKRSDFLFNLTKQSKEFANLIRISHNLTQEIINKRKSLRKGSEESPNISGQKLKSVIDILLEPSEDTLSDAEIREEVDTLMMAGTETAASTIMFVLILLGSYPEVQARVYKELVTVLGSSDRDVEKEDFSKLEYLEAVIKETLRIQPVAMVVLRHLDNDVNVGKYKLCAGTSCVLHLYAILRDPKLWGSDANQFKPERWLDPARIPKNHSIVWFSTGRRTCIGSTFAMMEMTTVLSHIIRRYRITADYSRVRCMTNFIVTPYFGHEIAIEKRANHDSLK